MHVRVTSGGNGNIGIVLAKQILDQVGRMLEALVLADRVATDHKQIPIAHIDELVHLGLGNIVAGYVIHNGTVRHNFGGHFEHRGIDESLVLKVVIRNPR